MGNHAEPYPIHAGGIFSGDAYGLHAAARTSCVPTAFGCIPDRDGKGEIRKMTKEKEGYREYREKAPGALGIEEAESIYQRMFDGCNLQDEDIAQFWDSLIERAVFYAHIRAGWYLQSRQERMEKDAARTRAHDALINAVEIIASLQKSEGRDISWWEELRASGSGLERKRIGDFGCYLALFQGLHAR